MNWKRVFAKDSVSHSMGVIGTLNISQRVFGIARGILFARLLGPANLGVYALTAFVLGVGIPVVSAGLASSYNRYVPRYEANGSLRAYYNSITAWSMWIATAFVAIALIFPRQVSSLLLASPDHANILRLTVITLLPAVYHRNLATFFKGLRVFRLSALLEFAQPVLLTVFAVAGFLWWQRTVEMAMWATLLSYLVPVAICGWMTRSFLRDLTDQKPRVEETDYARKIFRFSIWFVIIPTGLVTFDYVDRLMLAHLMQDPTTLGIYSQAFNTTALLLAVGYVPNGVLGPTLSAAWERHDQVLVQRTFNLALKVTLLLMLGASLVVVLIRGWVLAFLYGAEYAPGAVVLAPLLAFQCFDVMYSITGMYSGLIEKTYLPGIAVGIGLGLNVALNLVMIPHFGMRGAAYAAMISYGVVNIVLYLLNRRHGLQLTGRTLAVSALPLSLLLPPLALVPLAGAVLLASVRGSWIFEQAEKDELVVAVRQVGASLARRLRGPRPNGQAA